jgi:hypothetical protein
MKNIQLSRAIPMGIAIISAAILPIFFSSSISPMLSANPVELGNDDNEFTFSGQCESGDTYRLLAYQKLIDGKSYAHYDYEGPAGKGTVSTNATPRTMSVRVCRPLAEIIDDH